MTWASRLAPTGNMSVATQAITKYAKEYSPPFVPTTSVLPSTVSTSPSNTTWTELGPTGDIFNSGLNGIGQIHRIAFHPNYNNGNQIVYAGSHYGGLFRSENGGENWVNHYTDKGLPITSVSGIAVTLNNLFVCTGSGDFGQSNFGFNAQYNSLGPGTINNSNPIHTQGVYKFDASN